MQQKIDATPSLAANKSERGIWFWALRLLFFTTMISGFLWISLGKSKVDIESAPTVIYNENEKTVISNVEHVAQAETVINGTPEAINNNTKETKSIDTQQEKSNFRDDIYLQNSSKQTLSTSSGKSIGYQKIETQPFIEKHILENSQSIQSTNKQFAENETQNAQNEFGEATEALVSNENLLATIKEPRVYSETFTFLSPKEVSFREITGLANKLPLALSAAVNAGTKNSNTSFGMRISGVNFGVTMLTDFTTYNFGCGMGVDVQCKNWLFQTGICNYQITSDLVGVSINNTLFFDTTFTQTTRTDTILIVDSAYVIIGSFMGRLCI